MKKLINWIMGVLIISVFLMAASCPGGIEENPFETDTTEEVAPAEEAITFEEVSQPYLDQYGEPTEKRNNPYSDSLKSWNWDFGDRMFGVCFSLSSVTKSWRVMYEHFWHTFDQISQPYLDQYGSPEDVYEYKSSDYHSIDWWWWGRGFSVTFVGSQSLSGNWWVDSTFKFPPI